MAGTLPATLPFTLLQPKPNIRCLVSFSAFTADPPIWTDYTTRLRDWSTAVGRSDARSSFDAGTADVVLDNNDRALDPNAVAAVRPMNRLQLVEEFAGESHVIFSGTVDSWAQSWDRSGIKDAVVTARCSDALKGAKITKLPLLDPPGASSYAEVVQNDNPTHYWRWQEFTPFTTIYETLERPEGDPFHWTGLITWEYDNPPPTRVVEVSIPGWAVPSTGGGYGVGSTTGVVGAWTGSAEDGAGGCLLLQPTFNALYSTDRPAGQMLGGVEGAVELWISRESTTAANTTFWAAPQTLSIAGVPRLWAWSMLTTGAVNFTWVDNLGTARGVTSNVLPLNAWVHLFAVKTGSAMRLYQDGVNVSSNVVATNWAPDIDEDHPMLLQSCGANVRIAEMAVYVGRDLTDRVAAHYTAGTARGFPIGKAHERIGAVLDMIASHAPRSLRTGTRDIEASFTAGRNPLEEVAVCEACEGPDGAFFAALDGTLTFLDAGHRSVSPWNTSQATFDDDGTDLPYMGIEGFEESDAEIVNDWTVSKASRGAAVQTASDATSQATYGDRPDAISGLPLRANADAATIATALLAKTKDPVSRVTALQPKMSDPATATAVYRLDLLDQVTVIRRPPGGGSAITQAAWIQRIEHSGQANEGLVRCKLTVSTL